MAAVPWGKGHLGTCVLCHSAAARQELLRGQRSQAKATMDPRWAKGRVGLGSQSLSALLRCSDGGLEQSPPLQK